ncbi:MAG TPA: ATP-binding cassette domain-containing protein [Chthoniobacterales bacterium]|nr:ATP-binding cassette domain-containing protein [Chthoniobacterales bacterium]
MAPEDNAPQRSAPLLEADKVSKRFGGVHALKEVSLTLFPGEVLALAGDNGAGKSTLIKIISGVHPPDGGVLRYEGKEIKLDNPHQARAYGIETIYQDLALADNLDVGANVFLGREPVRRFFGLPFVDRVKMRTEAEKTLEALDIHIHRHSLPIRSLSGGQRQSVAIGRAIHWKARVLIMDEPTAALGVPEQRKVMELIANLKQSGVGVIFISHNLIDIFQVSDRIIVLRRGTKVGEVQKTETNPDAIVKLMVGG